MKITKALAAFTMFLSVAVPCQATTIASFTAGVNSATTFHIGQSVTTLSGNDWNNLTFNFFSDISGGTTPSAAGTLFLLDTEYLGTPNGLSALTPGYVGQSTSISGNIYSFAPGVTVLGGTQYFLYANAPVLVSGSNGGGYAGGTAYSAASATSNFVAFGGDANFNFSGTAVPEPASMALLALGLAGAAVRMRKARG